ncbi:MAG: hypothetical protein JWP97_2230 [Labilithrix sp.]|nr:hypothetical protein [Labilithrix sp.]
MPRAPRALLLLSLASLAAFSTGCAKGALEAPPPPPFTVTVLVESDPGRPLAGATVTRDERPVATTGADGRAQLTFMGADGEMALASVACPPGFTSPAKALSIRVARTRDGRTPVFNVACPPTQRKVVVAVKAEHGPNLPVLYLGNVVTRTDMSGAAHFALEAAPGEQFQVTLDTSGKDGEHLLPVSPSKPFTVGSTDDIVVFEQRFDRAKVKTVAAPRPTIAKCLGCAN